jgi:hypothetical protein
LFDLSCHIRRATVYFSGVMMKKIVFAAMVLMAVSDVSLAKKATTVAIKGLYCAQGGDAEFFPVKTFPPSLQKQLSRAKKGQKFNVNIAGFGPIVCTAY